MYKNIDSPLGFDDDDRPSPNMDKKTKEAARKVYAMVTNIDDNIHKILEKLNALKLVENTVVIFITDNGRKQARYIAGMRGEKASVYRGGVRVPFFMRPPKGLQNNQSIKTTAAHIDVMPTIANICQVRQPTENKIDGKSLLPLLKRNKIDMDKRPLFFY